MGTYYPNPLEVLEGSRGRQLVDKPERSHRSYLDQLEDGESLWLGARVASTDRPLVILVDDVREFDRVMDHPDGKTEYIFYALAAT